MALLPAPFRFPSSGGRQPPRKRVRSQCDVMQRTGPAQVQLEDPIKVASTSPASPGPIARRFGVVSVTQSTQDAPHNGSLLVSRFRSFYPVFE